MCSKKDIIIIIPLYNESLTIENTLNQWVSILHKLQLDYNICVFNDSSTDNSKEIVEKFKANNPNIKLFNCKHQGFSKILYFAYKNVKDSEYIFHADSDNEILPKNFEILYKERFNADLLLGYRIDRKIPIYRKIVTILASSIISFLFSNSKQIVHDANVPFRLIKTQLLSDILKTIPNFYLYPNLFITAYCLKKNLKIKEFSLEYNDIKKQKSYLNNIPKLLIHSIYSFITLIIYNVYLKK
jgi:glycosyltransferase involved in cell wall biosynthesis